MFFIPVLVFILPVTLRMLWVKKVGLRILSSTILCYGTWYLFSILLILSNVPFNIYMYIFYAFPIMIIIYEFINLIKNKHQITINKYFINFIIFLIILLLITLFTYKRFDDSTVYMDQAMIAKNSNSFIFNHTSPIYLFNDFYYIATSIGIANMTYFYTFVEAFILGTFFIIALYELIEIQFKKINKSIYLIIIAVVVSLTINNVEDLNNSNWLIGGCMTLLFYVWFIQEYNTKLYNKDQTVFIFSLLFLLQFSTTAIVVFIPLFIFISIFLIFSRKYNINIYSIAVLIIILPISISINLKNNGYFELSFLISYVITLFIAISSVLFFKYKNVFWISLSFLNNEYLFVEKLLRKMTKNKGRNLLIVNSGMAFMLIIIFIFLVFHKWPSVNNRLPTLPILPIFSLIPHKLSPPIYASTNIDRRYILFVLFPIISLIIIIVINLLILNNSNLSLLFLFLGLISTILYTFLQLKINGLPTYLNDRVLIGFSFFTFLLVLLITLNMVASNKKYIVFHLPNFLLLSLLFGMPLISITSFSFSFNPKYNLTNTSQKNKEFIYKNIPFNIKNKFSEVQLIGFDGNRVINRYSYSELWYKKLLNNKIKYYSDYLPFKYKWWLTNSDNYEYIVIKKHDSKIKKFIDINNNIQEIYHSKHKKLLYYQYTISSSSEELVIYHLELHTGRIL